MNDNAVIDFGDNFDFNNLPEVQKLLCMPNVLQELLLAVTNPELQNNKNVEDKNNKNQKNANNQGQNQNEDKYPDHANIEIIRANIEKVKNMSPDDFVKNGKFADLPEEIKIVMLYRIFELQGDVRFDYKKSFAENLWDMNEKYKEYPGEVLSKLLRLKFENQINAAGVASNSHSDFTGENKNLAQAIKNFLNDEQNRDLSNGLKNLLFEYYAFFNTDQNEIAQITNGNGKTDFKIALQAIKNTQDYKDADGKYKDAIMKGELKACKTTWDYNSDYISSSCQDLSEEEKVMIIPYLDNFYLQEGKRENIQTSKELAEFFLNKEIGGKKFASKVRVAMIRKFMLGNLFDTLSIQSWLNEIVKQIDIVNESIKNIPENMTAALASRAFDAKQEPNYNFLLDFKEIDIDQILDGILKEKDKINAFREESKRQQRKYQRKISLHKLCQFAFQQTVNPHNTVSSMWFRIAFVMCTTSAVLWLVFFLPDVLFYPLLTLFIINVWFRDLTPACINNLLNFAKDMIIMVAFAVAYLPCLPVIIYWGIKYYREQVRENNYVLEDVEENNLDLNIDRLNANDNINQNIDERRLPQQPLLENANDGNIVPENRD